MMCVDISTLKSDQINDKDRLFHGTDRFTMVDHVHQTYGICC
jgi:hypothetical protein